MSSRTYTKESTISKITCNEIVLELVGGNRGLAEAWWYGENLAFNNQAPISRPVEEVYNYLIQFI